ncbi:hypothetical protein HID58_070808, partial [Brassica napus]
GCLWPPELTLQIPLLFSSNSLHNFILCFLVCYVAISALCSTHSCVHPLRALLAEKRSSKSSALLITTYNRRDPPTSNLRLTLLYGSMSFLMVPLLRKALVSEEPLLHASTQHHQYRVLNCLSSSHVAQPVVRSPSLSSLSLCCVLFHHQWSKVQTDNFPLTHRLPSPTTTSRSVQGGPMYKAPSNESY